MYKTLLSLAALICMAVPAAAQTDFRCESTDGKYHQCRVNLPGDVTFTRQLSDAACIEGRTWGIRDGVVWVDHGCRAEFSLHTLLDRYVRCESIDGKPARCAADTSAGVVLVQKFSDATCDQGRDWGFDDQGIWVMRGCRAEFAVRSPVQTSMITCESHSGRQETCRAHTAHGVSLHRQISDAPCVLNQTWGYDQNGVWVRSGCRGEFVLGSLPAMTSGSALGTFVCESIDGRRNHCATNTSVGVRLIRQLSNADCQLNRTWGYDANGVWVSGGCRAEFALGATPPPPPGLAPGPRSASIVCESQDGKKKICPADTRLGVAVVRQMSDSPCTLNSTWGYDSDGIWVTAGCRAEFILRR
jgi:hypothetical protein